MVSGSGQYEVLVYYYCSNVCFNYLEETLSRKTNLFVLLHWGDSSHAKLLSPYLYLVRCAIWYLSYNLKNAKNTHGGVLILVKLQAEGCKFTKINTPRQVFFTFFRLCKWYQIAQRITYLPIVYLSFVVPAFEELPFYFG